MGSVWHLHGEGHLKDADQDHQGTNLYMQLFS